MSWAGIASNQIVSEANLADACDTGVFAARVFIPSTDRELTTTAATTAAIVSVTAGRASNQLVTKGSLSPLIVGPGPYNYYVYGTDGTSAYKSTNGGFTFVQLNTGIYFSTCIAASYSGQYVMVGSKGIANTIYVSTNSGLNFTAITIGNTTGSFTSFFPINVAMSSNGQYMAIIGKSTSGSNYGYITVAMSSNYGATFSVYTTAFYAGTANGCAIAISADGAYVSYVASIGSANNSYRYYSSNYGATFTSAGISSGQSFYDIAISSTGQYQLISDYNGNGFVSNNYGSSFTQRLVYTAISSIYCGMSDNGAVMGIYMLNGYYYESTNYGVTWDYFSYTPPASCIGLAFSTDNPAYTNYISVFQPTYCNYKTGASSTFYAQPLGYNMSSLSNIYKKAINY
jgi:hypothetical protein